MPYLRLIIYQPQAHYRVPFTYQRRHTYPIPPYSTIIGFLCNACGVDDQENDLYKEVIRHLKISIAGRFQTKNTEMVWFRNLAKSSHIQTYGSIENREKNGQIGHIGGQSPIKIDVLENVELVIYLYHNKKRKLEELKMTLEKPHNRLQVLHIGRAEDWIVYKDITMVDDDSIQLVAEDGKYPYFFWVPERMCNPTSSSDQNNLRWENIDGIPYILTTHSHIENYEQHHNHTGKRVYEKINAKLNDGKIMHTQYLFDKETNIPIFLGDL